MQSKQIFTIPFTVLCGGLALLWGCETVDLETTPPSAGPPSQGKLSSDPLRSSIHDAEEQQEIFQQYEESPSPSVRERSALVLSNLWQEGLLSEQIKAHLVQEHYRLDCLQDSGDYRTPAFLIKLAPNFPFPEAVTKDLLEKLGSAASNLEEEDE